VLLPKAGQATQSDSRELCTVIEKVLKLQRVHDVDFSAKLKDPGSQGMQLVFADCAARGCFVPAGQDLQEEYLEEAPRSGL